MLLLKQLLKVEKFTAANTDASVIGLAIHLQHCRGRPLHLSRGASTCEDLKPQKQEQGRVGLLQMTARKTQESSIVPTTTPQILTVISLIFYKAT